MHHPLMSLYVALLFFIICPGILVTLPTGRSSKLTVALVHALAFAVVYHFTHKAVWKYFYENH